MPTRHSPVRFDFVIDGSNVLLENKIGRTPSVRLFAALLHMLDQNGRTYKIWFDASIHRHLAEKGGDIVAFKSLIAALSRKNCLDSASHADPGIQQDCQHFGAPVINGGDKNDSWRGFIPKIVRCRAQRSRTKGIAVFLAAAGSSKKLMTFDASGAFRYEDMVFDALGDDDQAEVGRNFAQRPRLKGTRSHGNLLVLALDASGSMDETDTHDGRPKHAHVNEILHSTLRRLKQTSIASRLWISVVAFSDEVVEHTPDDSSDALFSLVGDWAGTTIDYLGGIDRGLTNVRLALDRSANLIDGFRHSDVSRELAMNWDAATVVLLTDGEHNTNVNGRFETASDIDDHIYTTINRSENVSFGFIGLGASAKHDAMQTWATKATDQQNAMAQRMSIPLVGGSLYVRVDATNANLEYVVRSFIDIASSRGK